MLTAMTPRQRRTADEFSRRFDYIGHTGWGFAFPCNEQGEPIGFYWPEARANLDACLDPKNPLGVVDRGVVRNTHSWIEPATGICRCGTRVELYDSLYNECEGCGQGYNGCGRELAPVSQWEPEDVYDTFGPRNRRDED